MAYHDWFRDRYCRICVGCCNTQHSSAICCVLHIPRGRVLGQFGHHRLGVVDFGPNEGEESCKFVQFSVLLTYIKANVLYPCP